MKYFKRILKDLGLYHKWVTARKKHEFNCDERNKKYFYTLVSMNPPLSRLIDSSFIWADTNDVNLWIVFDDAANSAVTWKTAKEFCCESGINYLKERLKNYIG